MSPSDRSDGASTGALRHRTHLRRARALIESRRFDRVGEATHPLWTPVGRGMDAVALQVMQRIFVAGHRANTRRVDDVRELEGGWLALAEGGALTTHRFFPVPEPPALAAVERAAIAGGRVVDLSFASNYAPWRATAASMLARYPRNARAHARCYRHDDRGHPAVIWLHGWGMGEHPVEARLARARQLYRRGWDVYLHAHPFHGVRRAPEVRFSGTLHPSTHVTRSNEAFLQAAWEVRALLADHRRRTGAGGGVIGFSLGGYLGAVLASVAAELAFAALINPFADLPALLWWLGEGTRERREAEAAGITFDDFCRAMIVHAPLARELVVPRERVLLIGGGGDRIIPPRHTRALHEHWQRPQLCWYPGGHLLHAGRRRYLERLDAFLDRWLHSTDAHPQARK